MRRWQRIGGCWVVVQLQVVGYDGVVLCRRINETQVTQVQQESGRVGDERIIGQVIDWRQDLPRPTSTESTVNHRFELGFILTGAH